MITYTTMSFLESNSHVETHDLYYIIKTKKNIETNPIRCAEVDCLSKVVTLVEPRVVGPAEGYDILARMLACPEYLHFRTSRCHHNDNQHWGIDVLGLQMLCVTKA